MGTGDRIEQCFIDLVETMPYDKITVSNICTKAGMSRTAFYMRFHDKQDIVESLFRKHVLNPLEGTCELLGFLGSEMRVPILYELIYCSIYQHKDYYCHLVGVRSDPESVFVVVATKCIYELTMQTLDVEYHDNNNWEKDYAAYFLASSQAMLMQKWIREKMTVDPHDLAFFYEKMSPVFSSQPQS